MKTLFLIFALLFTGTIFAHSEPPYQLDDRSLDLLSALAANSEKFQEFSKLGNQVDVVEASVQYLSSTETRYSIKGVKVEGDILLGDVSMKITKTRHGTDPEYIWYTYTTEISNKMH